MNSKRKITIVVSLVAAGILFWLYFFRWNVNKNRLGDYINDVFHVANRPKENTTPPKENTTPPKENTTPSEDELSLGMALYRMLYHDPLQYKCRNIEHVPNNNDMPEYFCVDEEWALHKPCLVYSFGINYNWHIEDMMAAKGCDVYTFDPSMTDVQEGKRGESVWFFRTGLGATNSGTFQARKDLYWKKNTPWKIRTLDTLVRQLGHENRTIDLLKVDIECNEWIATGQMLDSGVLKHVKHFVVEWHVFKDCPPRSLYKYMLSVLVKLRRSGFLSYHRSPHTGSVELDWKRFNVQADYRYVNVNYTKDG